MFNTLGLKLACSQAWLVQQKTSDFYEGDLDTGEFLPVEDDFAGHINAIGFNIMDRKMYGIATDEALDKNAEIVVAVVDPATRPIHVELVRVPIAPGSLIGTARNWVVGDCDTQGNFYVTSNGQKHMIRLSVDPDSPDYLATVEEIPLTWEDGSPASLSITDWAVSPLDGLLYSLANRTHILQTTDPTTGVCKQLGDAAIPLGGLRREVYGAAYSNHRGQFFVSANNGGGIWRMDFTAGLSDSPVAEFHSQGPAGVAWNDGARCTFGN